ncbi:MAG: hypothetical protein HQ534_08730 [Armatimonadetes bacterium]|nr:hypothetical protein [Armatimonadota bacterium]
MKKVFFLLMLIIPILIFAQDEEPASNGLNMGGGIGTVLMGGETYSQIRLMPELVLGKFGLGLDIELLIDSEGNVREEDWDEFEDYVNKIYYLRYGQRGDSFFGKIGGFPYYTLGHGLIMKDYSNMLRYPQVRQLGVQLGGKLPFAGLELEVFTSNITENDILAGRVVAAPLKEMNLPIISNIKFGATVVHDANQYNGLLDSDDDNYANVFDDFPDDEDYHNLVDYEIEFYQSLYEELFPDSSQSSFENWFYNSPTLNELRNPSMSELGEEGITVFGVDYEIPLLQTDLFFFSHYGELAQIVDHKMGFIFPGFYSKFLIFHMNLEFRMYQDDFMPAYFNNLYEEQRAVVYGDSVILKESLLDYTTESKGWYASLTSDLFNVLKLTVSYEDMYGEDDENVKSLWGKLAFNNTFIPKLNIAEVNYSQTGFEKLKYFKTPSSLIEGKLGYTMSANTVLVGTYQERYVDLDGNGKIKGKDETIKTMNFGVEFRF